MSCKSNGELNIQPGVLVAAVAVKLWALPHKFCEYGTRCRTPGTRTMSGSPKLDPGHPLLAHTGNSESPGRALGGIGCIVRVLFLSLVAIVLRVILDSGSGLFTS